MAAKGLRLEAAVTRWPMKAPFIIHGYRWDHMDVVTVSVSRGTCSGRGEGAPLFYDNESGEDLQAALLALPPERLAAFEANQDALEDLPSGARNALDAALLDLAAKEANVPAHVILGKPMPRPLKGLATVTLDSPTAMAEQAKALADIPVLKLKLGGDCDLDAAKAVREARPDATLITDINCGWTLAQLDAALPVLQSLNFAMIEQPLPPSEDSVLEGFQSPTPICADESCRSLNDLSAVKNRYQMINIKLDKCGGLTAALALAAQAQSDGLSYMVGNMLGSSLAMAPAFLLAQDAAYADLDGPLYLTQDCASGLEYRDGLVHPPTAQLWG